MNKDDVVVFDIESNGLLNTVSIVWVIAATNLKGDQQWIFTDEYVGGEYKKSGTLKDGVKFLASRKGIICQNMFGYDFHLLEKFWPELWNRKTVPFKKCWDTYMQSKCQHFNRPKLKGVKSNHSLAYYGQLFSYPKPDIEDWSYWDQDKLNRVLMDIEINRRQFWYLQDEAKKVGIDFSNQIRRSQAAQYWCTKQELGGFYGNRKLMEESVVELDQELEQLRLEIEPKLPNQIKVLSTKESWDVVRASLEKNGHDISRVPTGEEKDSYKPVAKYKLKNGKYDKFTAKHFDISDDPELSDNYVSGPYTKIEIVGSKMSQHAIVKDFLLNLGWKPTQWNFEKNKDGSLAKDINGKPIKKSPKLTEDSFDSIDGELGNKIALYNTLTHRRRTIKNEKDNSKGWLNQLREDDRIEAGNMVWQTETGRASQKNLVNVPSSSAVYGERMREVWTCPENTTLVSVDMDGAQLRLLANFMGDDDYTRAVLEGEEFNDAHEYVGTDPHTKNAIAFGTLSEEDVNRARNTQNEDLIKKITSIRKISKNGTYAYLFGAGDAKLANTLKVRGGASKGKQLKDSFKRKLTKVADLEKYLKKTWLQNRYKNGGYIEVAGGTWVWCNSEHKLLNYLLMGSEACLQNEAICWVNYMNIIRGLHGEQKAVIHDEATFEFPIEEEKQGIQLLTEMYGEASKRIGLDVLVTGTAQSGRSWLAIH